MINYEIISTGSQGNAVVINESILIDCGVSFKSIKNVYKQLKIVMLTHEHQDHINKTTIRILAEERPTLRFACCEWMVKHLLECGVEKKNIDVLEIGKRYDYGFVKVQPIKLYHNVPNCGYRMFFGEEKLIYATDTSTLQGITAKDYDLYMLEANYTKEEIAQRINLKRESGEYPYELQVLKNHLSKEECDDFIYKNIGSKGSYVYLHQHKNLEE